MSTQAATVQAPPGPRSQIGRYRLLGAIGHGGMADVYLASTPSPLGVHKLLVVKQLRRGQDDQHELVTMFLDEARIAVRLGHPNVVQIYDVDVDDGLPFIAMEYLEGQPLHRVLRRFGEHGGLARDTQLWILGELLAGLHHAHELRGFDGRPLRVVHRDVNPQNVFVTYHGVVKLVDFGIAKAMDSVSQTDVGMFKGKLAYMAPEQVCGRIGVDRGVDLFAVGVMMWEALTGRRLWQGRSDLEIANALSRGLVPALPAELAIEAPLRAICERAMALEPADRWPTAEAMRDALQGWLREHGQVPDRAVFGRALADQFAEERARRAELIHRYTHSTGGHASVGVVGADGGQTTDDRSDPDDDTRPITPAMPMRHEPETSAASPREEGWRSRRAAVGIALTGVALVGTLLGITWRFASAPTATPIPPSEPTLRPDPTVNGLAPSQPMSSNEAASPGCVDHGEPVTLTGDLDRDATLACDRVYLLQYETRVRPGVVLTIEPGTTILGDTATKGTLVVEPGGRLWAEGRPDAPIVFTSAKPPAERRPGDWGGVLVLGRAPVNLRDHDGRPIYGQVEGLMRSGRFGGEDPNDDSGVLRYVRIEYSGIELAPNNEINGLSLAGVGRGTRLDHVQVRHAADDCFELFGGTVDGTHLLCDDPGDDGFDWDLGYRGHLRFLVVRSTSLDRGHHGLEGDNAPQGDRVEPRSSPRLSNVTLCGAAVGDRRGVLLRRGTDAHVERALVLGYDAAVDVRDPETSFEVVDSILGGPAGVVAATELHGVADGPQADDDASLDEAAVLLQPAWRNMVQAPGLPSCAGVGPEGLFPAAMLPVQGIATTEPGGAYVGAFRNADDRWDEGWAVWGSLP